MRYKEFGRNLKKYWKYVFAGRSLEPTFPQAEMSEHARAAGFSIRGGERPPAIMIHGVMKRSGTVYLGELLSLHPDVCGHPNQLWETPFLSLAGSIKSLQNEFFFEYEQNRGRMGGEDFLPILGASFVSYLYSFVPQGQKLLVKSPGVQYLNHFYSMFPHEHLLVLIRDGRDVVASTVKTWPQIRFSDACRRWDRSVKMILACHERYAGREGYWLARYEDAVRDPDSFVEEACRRFGLDPARYPFEKVKTLPVIGSSTTRKQGESWMKNKTGFKPIGRWQKWSTVRKWIFKAIAGESLKKLGYCPDHHW